jgi:AraC-like DNA-binding protein
VQLGTLGEFLSEIERDKAGNHGVVRLRVEVVLPALDLASPPEVAAGGQLDLLVHELGRRLEETVGWHPTLERALTLISARYQQPLSVVQIAAGAFCSSSYLTELFRSDLGISPHQFLIAYRVERAKLRFLSNPRNTVTRVAMQSGFTSLRNLERGFLKWVGCSPQSFRQSLLSTIPRWKESGEH